ncbi:hypothetical protein HK098_003524 [Nowakowskiella sp. JEL0407]|nr:hypothetical protein HK098_003524 [Nowakowskiella sp. JEL0407]
MTSINPSFVSQASIPDTEQFSDTSSNNTRKFKSLMTPWLKKKSKIPTAKSTNNTPDVTLSVISNHIPPKISQETVERTVAAKIYFETHFLKLSRKSNPQLNPRHGKSTSISSTTGNPFLQTKRSFRQKITLDHFEFLKTLGSGAFGIVKLVRERSTGEIYAMKIIRKSTTIIKGYENHIRAERDLLSLASERVDTKWITKLIYSFQDTDYLYFVMEFLQGGDMLGLLIKEDVFKEDVAKFYAAEMVLALEEIHSLGIVHRDIKPDNFLITADGHIRLSDFGLATDMHYIRSSDYYTQHRAETERQLSNSLSMLSISLSPPTSPEKPKVLHRRSETCYSVVGTNNYIAPEILSGQGYDQRCDWWSLGVIIFEMLYGYPPFASESKQNTKKKIVSWRKYLRFPSSIRVSNEAKDLITKLICHKEDRITPETKPLLQSLKYHPWFEDINWTRIHTQKAPFQPVFSGPTDTRYFDKVDPEVERKWFDPSSTTDGDGTKNGMDRNVLDMRKKLAFVGF